MNRDEAEGAFDEMLRMGLIEQVGERDGEPTYRLTAKGEAWGEEQDREEACRKLVKRLGL